MCRCHGMCVVWKNMSRGTGAYVKVKLLMTVYLNVIWIFLPDLVVVVATVTVGSSAVDAWSMTPGYNITKLLHTNIPT
jgi:hypothetical protein